MTRVFASKVDRWLVILFALSALSAIVGCAAAAAVADGAELLVMAVSLAIAIGLPVWILRSTRYTLDEQTLKVHSGPFSWTIPLREITSITPTRSPLSSPALSLDRLRIEYGGRALMISPRDRQEFLSEIEARRGSVPRAQ